MPLDCHLPHTHSYKHTKRTRNERIIELIRRYSIQWKYFVFHLSKRIFDLVELIRMIHAHWISALSSQLSQLSIEPKNWFILVYGSINMSRMQHEIVSNLMVQDWYSVVDGICVISIHKNEDEENKFGRWINDIITRLIYSVRHRKTMMFIK